MGFAKPKTSSAPVATPPPTVYETADEEVRTGYGQEAAHRKGLLSTILTNRRRAESSGGGSGAGSTLG